MGLRGLYEKVDRYVHVVSRKMGVKSSVKHYKKLLAQHNIAYKKLTSAQKAEVRKIWGSDIKGIGFATHELVLSVSGRFDPYVCPELIFRTKIELAMNNFQLKFGFSDKNYFDKLFSSYPMPKTVVRNVNGVLLNEDYAPITADEAMRIIDEYSSVIVKPSIDNGFGRSVKLYSKDEYGKIFTEFKSNYLIQEVLTQHESISRLNRSSINVVRVVSLNINGKVSAVNCAIRCGAEGAITDNFVTKDGRGMFIVGINADGSLKNEAYHSCGERITVAPNGENFAGIKVPNFEKAIEMTTRMHEQLPHFGFIGFDVCFDEDGSARIMELNFKGPGVLYYQYVNGALFGERTQEVIDTFLK